MATPAKEKSQFADETERVLEEMDKDTYSDAEAETAPDAFGLEVLVLVDPND